MEVSSAQQLGVIGHCQILKKRRRKKEIVLNSDVANSRKLKCQY
jgi:hypothetical protein